MVVKKDGRREPFDRAKIIGGLKRACEKRPVSMETIEQIANNIETTMAEQSEREVAASVIGSAVMNELASSDVRVMVPIADLGDRYKYWVVIGVRATLGGYSYIEGTSMSAPTPDKTAKLLLPTEQFLEVNSSRTPLNRDELRKLCDEKKTAEAIKAAIESR